MPTYLKFMRPQVARFWRQVPSQALTCPWAHIGRLQVLARERSPCIFSHGASASSKQLSNGIWFMFVINFLRDPTSNTTSAMYTVNLRIRDHLEQESFPLFQIRQPTTMLLHNFVYEHTHTRTRTRTDTTPNDT